MQADYYNVLGVERDADDTTIKKAYRRLAMKYHPDKNPGDQAAEDKFKEAAEAYEVLGNPEKRAKYDRFGHAGVNGGFQGTGGFHDVNDIFSAFGDIFGDFFGGGGPQRGRAGQRVATRGSDLRYRLDVNLKDVLKGLQKDIEFDVEESCGKCSGSGANPGSEVEVCATCGGAGQVVRQQGFFSMATTCPSCHGQGQTIKDPCGECFGKGRVQAHRKLRVNIPPGVDNGTRLRMPGEGEGGYFGGGAGDLYVEVHVKPHRKFQRQDDHLLSQLDISYLQGILGAEIEVDGLDEKVKVKVSAGTSTGDLVKVSSKGVPSLRSGRRGDLVFQVQIKMPKKLDKEEEKLLRQVAEVKGESVAPEGKGLFGRKK